MSKRQRRSRAKPQTDGELARMERAFKERRRADERPEPTLRITPALWENIREAMKDVPVPEELAVSVDPAVDRRALIQAVLCWDFEDELFKRWGAVDPQQAFRWLLLCRVRAAMDELRELAHDLGDVVSPVLPDDPRNEVPVSTEHLWRVAHPGREPRNTAEVSRWFAAKVCGPQGCDPDPPNPSVSRRRVTVNLRLFREKCCPRLTLDEVRRQIP